MDTQIERLLGRLRPHQAIVLPAALAYMVLIKALGMGVPVALRDVEGSDTKIRVYRMPFESFETTFPRAAVR